jgi:AcrR family transcriptional regulator
MSFSSASERASALVDAARVLAGETGSAAFTVAQVAERAGCSLKGFYSCFAAKDDLLIALLAAESRTGANVLARTVQKSDDPLAEYVSSMLAFATFPRARGYARVLAQEHRRLAETRPAELDAALAPLVDLLGWVVSDWRDAHTIFSLILSGVHEVALGRADASDTAAYLTRFCRGALAGVGR